MTTIANDSHNVKASNLRPSNQKAPTSSTKPRVKFNEKEIAVDMEERGKLYGTMKIDQVETPFIYYDADDDPMVAQYKPNAPPEKVEAKALQEALGILLEQQKGNCGGAPVEVVEDLEKWKQADKHMTFVANRHKLYSNEASVLKQEQSHSSEIQNNIEDETLPVCGIDLPEGWLAYRSRSCDGKLFYYHAETDTCTWDIPKEKDNAEQG